MHCQKDAYQEGGGMQDRRDAGLEGYRTGGMLGWRDIGQEGFRAGGMQDR